MRFQTVKALATYLDSADSDQDDDTAVTFWPVDTEDFEQFIQIFPRCPTGFTLFLSTVALDVYSRKILMTALANNACPDNLNIFENDLTQTQLERYINVLRTNTKIANFEYLGSEDSYESLYEEIDLESSGKDNLIQYYCMRNRQLQKDKTAYSGVVESSLNRYGVQCSKKLLFANVAIKNECPTLFELSFFAARNKSLLTPAVLEKLPETIKAFNETTLSLSSTLEEQFVKLFK